jgi:hypothetical protein
MKRVLIAFLFSVCLSKVSNARIFNPPDTLTYLQSIVANKANYVGKAFSTLLSDLQIQIKYFSPVGGLAYDTSKETRTLFSFYFPQSADEIYLTYPYLRISWEPYLNANTSHYLYNKNDGGGWTQAVMDFYRNAIIKDIDIFE